MMNLERPRQAAAPQLLLVIDDVDFWDLCRFIFKNVSSRLKTLKKIHIAFSEQSSAQQSNSRCLVSFYFASTCA